MNTQEFGEHLKTLMEREIVLFLDLADAEEQLKQHLVAKAWEGLSGTLGRMDAVSLEISGVEAERAQAVEDERRISGLPLESSFYEIIAGVDEPLRSECMRLYRELRIAVLRVKSSGGNIRAYTESASSSIREILEEIFPHRKGKMYTRRGTPRSAGESSLVFDRQL